MSEVNPTLTIIAGPNGSGKSTFTRATIEALKVPVIDPDEDARLFQPASPETAAIQGGKEAIKRARTYLAENESFAVETTLSGHTYLRMMVDAKRRGWQVNLIYIGVDNVLVSIQRVAQRVARGGHDVPEEDIRRRYTRSLNNLILALQHADRVSIFDNSTSLGHRKVLTIEGGQITERASEVPEWVTTLLPRLT